jgi:hypothetical protein
MNRMNTPRAVTILILLLSKRALTCILSSPYPLDHLRYTTVAGTVLRRTRPSTKLVIHHCNDCRGVEIDEGRSYGGSFGMIIQGRQLRPLLLVPS